MAMQDFANALVSFKINGEIQDVVADVEYTLSGMKREAAAGATGNISYTEKHVVPGMKLSIRDRRGLDLQKVFNMVGGTVIAHKANGKAVILRDATYGGDRTAHTESGEAPLELFGAMCEEVNA